MTTDSKTDHFHALSPYRYKFVEELHISQYQPSTPNGECSVFVQLVARQEQSNGKIKLRLKFHDVTDLKIRPGDGKMTCQLDIRSIKSYHWHSKNYRVVEEENGLISFFCNDFQADLIEEQPI